MARASVTVWCFVERPMRVLLLRRPPERAPGWQPVTGRVEASDASREAACLREVREETGLPSPDALLDLGEEEPFLGYDGETYHPHAFAARYREAAAPIVSAEHEEALWATVEEARALLRWDQDRETLERLVRMKDEG